MDVTITPENKSNAYGKSNWVKMLLIYLVIGGMILYTGIYYFVLAKKGPGRGQNQTPPVYTQPSAPAAPPTSSPAAVTPETQNKITLTSDGFMPQTLTIKAGETVTWENSSGETATVNSNPHPIHTNYPPLNLGSFNDGEMFTLKFDKPGTYGYHNHLNPSQTGKIVVE